jgi:hypothetical protein
VFVAGYFEGTIDFGNEPLRSKGGCDMFIAKLHASGSHAWSATYLGAATPLALSLAMGKGGELFVAGHLDAPARGRVVPSTEPSQDNLCLARVGPAGELRWCTVVGRADETFGIEVATDGAGGVLLSMYGLGPVTLGPRLHAETPVDADFYLVNFA